MGDGSARVHSEGSCRISIPLPCCGLQGRAACEIRSGDELLATEMIFSGLLGELSHEEALAIMVALIFQARTAEARRAPPGRALQPSSDRCILVKSQEKSDNSPRLTDRVRQAKAKVLAIAKTAGAVQQQCGLQVSPDELCETALNWGLSEVVYEWARGTSFHEICSLTDVMEGSIVRTIVRLEELCRQFTDVARVMGNPQLYQLMERAREAIKRDVIFAASLYLS